MHGQDNIPSNYPIVI